MKTKHLIVKAGITQLALAEKIGVHETTVGKWLARRIPAERVADVSAATGIPAADLRPDLAATFLPTSAGQ